MQNPRTGVPSRDRTYRAIDEEGNAIGATITERVLSPSGDLASVDNPVSSQGGGVFEDQVGLGFLQKGQASTYQYFVTTLPGGSWTNVPTPVHTANGTFMVFSIVASATYNAKGDKIYNVTYNGDAGMWNADGSPRLPICGR
jgi:hypothetical protein